MLYGGFAGAGANPTAPRARATQSQPPAPPQSPLPRTDHTRGAASAGFESPLTAIYSAAAQDATRAEARATPPAFESPLTSSYTANARHGAGLRDSSRNLGEVFRTEAATPFLSAAFVSPAADASVPTAHFEPVRVGGGASAGQYSEPRARGSADVITAIEFADDSSARVATTTRPSFAHGGNLATDDEPPAALSWNVASLDSETLDWIRHGGALSDTAASSTGARARTGVSPARATSDTMIHGGAAEGGSTSSAGASAAVDASNDHMHGGYPVGAAVQTEPVYVPVALDPTLARGYGRWGSKGVKATPARFFEIPLPSDGTLPTMLVPIAVKHGPPVVAEVTSDLRSADIPAPQRAANFTPATQPVFQKLETLDQNDRRFANAEIEADNVLLSYYPPKQDDNTKETTRLVLAPISTVTNDNNPGNVTAKQEYRLWVRTIKWSYVSDLRDPIEGSNLARLFESLSVNANGRPRPRLTPNNTQSINAMREFLLNALERHARVQDVTRTGGTRTRPLWGVNVPYITQVQEQFLNRVVFPMPVLAAQPRAAGAAVAIQETARPIPLATTPVGPARAAQTRGTPIRGQRREALSIDRYLLFSRNSMDALLQGRRIPQEVKRYLRITQNLRFYLYRFVIRSKTQDNVQGNDPWPNQDATVNRGLLIVEMHVRAAYRALVVNAIPVRITAAEKRRVKQLLINPVLLYNGIYARQVARFVVHRRPAPRVPDSLPTTPRTPRRPGVTGMPGTPGTPGMMGTPGTPGMTGTPGRRAPTPQTPVAPLQSPFVPMPIVTPIRATRTRVGAPSQTSQGEPGKFPPNGDLELIAVCTRALDEEGELTDTEIGKIANAVYNLSKADNARLVREIKDIARRDPTEPDDATEGPTTIHATFVEQLLSIEWYTVPLADESLRNVIRSALGGDNPGDDPDDDSDDEPDDDPKDGPRGKPAGRPGNKPGDELSVSDRDDIRVAVENARTRNESDLPRSFGNIYTAIHEPTGLKVCDSRLLRAVSLQRRQDPVRRSDEEVIEDQYSDPSQFTFRRYFERLILVETEYSEDSDDPHKTILTRDQIRRLQSMTVSAFFRRNVANNEGDDFEPRLLFTADQRMWDANLLEGDEALPLTTQLSMQEVVQACTVIAKKKLQRELGRPIDINVNANDIVFVIHTTPDGNITEEEHRLIDRGVFFVTSGAMTMIDSVDRLHEALVAERAAQQSQTSDPDTPLGRRPRGSAGAATTASAASTEVTESTAPLRRSRRRDKY
jgi:hypothetical protein